MEDLDEQDSEDEPDDAAPEETPRVIESLEIPDRKIYCLDLRVRKDSKSYLEEIQRIVGEASVATIQPTEWLSGQPREEHIERLINPPPGNVEHRENPIGPNNEKAPKEATVIEFLNMFA